MRELSTPPKVSIRQLFVSGTMGLDASGEPPKTIDEQLHLIWNNIRSILGAADMTTDNVVRVTSYLTRPEYAKKTRMPG